ncbi:MAG: hypothetical protein JXB88_17745 [Spirochaetales bacterium]|nr:hypothetical protein [Spirochaetales bacterium]
MLDFLTGTIIKVLTGYLRILKVIGVFILRIIVLCFFSFLIVFPQWYFAIHYKLGYNIFVVAFLFLIILFTVGAKLIKYIAKEFKKGSKTGFGLPVLPRFVILVLELYLIRYFLLSGQIFFMVAGIVLVFEFLFFLCLIKEDKAILISWMKTVLIILTSFEIMYTGSVLFTRGNHFYALSIGVMYLLAIGYLPYKPGAFRKMTAGKRSQCENEKSI